jgi:hypothetical protein
LIPLSELDRSAINPQALAYVLCRESGPEGFTSMGSRDFMLRTVSREYWKPSDKVSMDHATEDKYSNRA